MAIPLLKSLKEYSGDDRVITIAELNAQLESRGGNRPYTAKSGFSHLDALLEDFEAGELIVVSGPAKTGKSLFLQSLTMSFSAQNIISLWLSYEMTLRQFIMRFGKNMPDACMPTIMKSNTIDWINDRVLESKEKFGSRILMIDHLHFLVDMARLNNPSLEIGSILRGLKRIAITQDMIIFLVAHIGKVPHGEVANASHMRDSSFLTQEPDVVLFINRIKDEPGNGIINQSVLSVELSRRTGCKEKGFNMIKDNGLLRPLTEQEILKQNIKGGR
jgi:replicative DNA helicase